MALGFRAEASMNTAILPSSVCRFLRAGRPQHVQAGAMCGLAVGTSSFGGFGNGLGLGWLLVRSGVGWEALVACIGTVVALALARPTESYRR